MSHETRTIEGRELQCEVFDFDDGWLLFVRIAGIIAPAMGTPKSIAEALAGMELRLDAVPIALLREGAALLDTLFARTYWLSENKRVRLNTKEARNRCFGNAYHVAIEAAYFVLECNYRDCIEAAQRKLSSP